MHIELLLTLTHSFGEKERERDIYTERTNAPTNHAHTHTSSEQVSEFVNESGIQSDSQCKIDTAQSSVCRSKRY